MSAIRKAGEERFRKVSEEIASLEYNREQILNSLISVQSQIEQFKNEHKTLGSELFRDNTDCMGESLAMKKND